MWFTAQWIAPINLPSTERARNVVNVAGNSSPDCYPFPSTKCHAASQTHMNARFRANQDNVGADRTAPTAGGLVVSADFFREPFFACPTPPFASASLEDSSSRALDPTTTIAPGPTSGAGRKGVATLLSGAGGAEVIEPRAARVTPLAAEAAVRRSAESSGVRARSRAVARN